MGMKAKTTFSLLAAVSLLGGASAFAGDAKTYQVTGPVISMNDSMIVVEKEMGKNERWEVARNSSSKVPADIKVGDKVTIKYQMVATEVRVKSKGSTADTSGAQKKEKN